MARWLARREREALSWAQLAWRSGHPIWKLRYWQRRLRVGRSTKRTPAFVAVEVTPSVASLGATIEITTPSGYRLHVPRDFDVEHLRRLVDALKSC